MKHKQSAWSKEKRTFHTSFDHVAAAEIMAKNRYKIYRYEGLDVVLNPAK
jgi:hypothetical protein